MEFAANRTKTIHSPLQKFAKSFIGIVAFIGIAVLIGWQFNISFIKRPIPGLAAMNPLTAICFILAAISLGLTVSTKDKGVFKKVVYFTIALLLLLSLLRIADFLINSSSHTDVDEILFRGEMQTDSLTSVSSRMAPNTAISFLLVGLICILIRVKKIKPKVSQWIAIFVSLIAMFSILGYLYRVREFYGILVYVPMSIHTAVCFFMLSLAFLFITNDKGIMQELTSSYGGGAFAKILIPLAILIPLSLGYLRLVIYWKYPFTVELGLAILILTIIVTFVVLIWFFAHSTNKNDALQKLAEEEISALNRELEEKNKDIIDSIEYAKLIQHANLPSKENVYAALPDSFVLYKPKAIVSGDFYFFNEKEESILIASADCTGHGVPGAMMSMLCLEKLNNALLQTRKPSEILRKVNEGIKASLHQTKNKNNYTKDGMDIALCAIDKTNCTVTYAGANRPFWLFPKGSKDVKEIKPTKAAIGGFTKANQNFDSIELKLNKGDTFYICSDGYADQFGGAHGKKLKTKKLKQLLIDIQHKTMKEQEHYLENFATQWKGDLEQVDDILMIGVRI